MQDLIKIRDKLNKILAENTDIKLAQTQVLNEEHEVLVIHPDDFHGHDRSRFVKWYRERKKYRNPKVGDGNIEAKYYLILVDTENTDDETVEVTCYVSANCYAGTPDTRWTPGEPNRVEDMELCWIEGIERKLLFDEMFSVWMAWHKNRKIQDECEDVLWASFETKYY